MFKFGVIVIFGLSRLYKEPRSSRRRSIALLSEINVTNVLAQ